MTARAKISGYDVNLVSKLQFTVNEILDLNKEQGVANQFEIERQQNQHSNLTCQLLFLFCFIHLNSHTIFSFNSTNTPCIIILFNTMTPAKQTKTSLHFCLKSNKSYKYLLDHNYHVHNDKRNIKGHHCSTSDKTDKRRDNLSSHIKSDVIITTYPIIKPKNTSTIHFCEATRMLICNSC